MKKNLVLLITLLISQVTYSQNIDSTASEFWQIDNSSKVINSNSKLPAPANDNCANASTLTVGGSESCFNTDQSSIQAGEGVCRGLGGGAAYETVWFLFQATSNQTTISLNNTGGATSCGTDVVVFGGWSTSALATAACLPGNSNLASGCITFSVYDPGYSFDFTSDSSKWYLISIQNQSCGGPGVRDYEGCIRLFDTPTNNSSNNSASIDQCGVVFNGTNIGYSPSNALPGNENLDGNNSTTCPTCTAGDDVPYVVNNDSWFSFCATSAGVWNVDFSGISNCYYNYGLQMSIFTGTPNNLTLIQHAPSPSTPSSSWTSSNISLNAGECVYLVVDGFAGDQCDYQYTLNNVSGGCNLLPVRLLNFNANYNAKNAQVVLDWKTISEINNDYFTIEKSIDGENFEVVGIVDGAGNSSALKSYNSLDEKPYNGTSYYRLKQTDFDGKFEYSDLVPVKIEEVISNPTVYPNPITNNGVLEFNTNSTEVTVITIYDVSGRIVLNKQHFTNKGINKIQLETSELTNGMYFISLKNGNNKMNLKFIKE